MRLRAASLNYRDLLMVEGKYNPKQKLPLIPCSDGAGEVVEVGEGVTRVQPGDRVCGIFAQSWLAGEPNRERLRATLGGPLDGTLAELVVLDQDGVVKIPAAPVGRGGRHPPLCRRHRLERPGHRGGRQGG